MAISGVSGTTSYRDNWESNGGIYGADETDSTSSTDTTEKIWNAVFTDKKQSAVSTEDFLSLMVAQMTNQDFMNPMDDTQFVTQLAQFSSMQMMQEMANYSKTSYVMSLVGKNVTAARITVSGNLEKETGPVQKITLTNNEFGIYVNDKKFSLEQLMEIGTTAETGSDATDELPSVNETSRKSYLNSLIGREVTINTTKEDEYGEFDVEITGIVEKVSSKDGNYRVFVDGKWYSLDDVSEVGDKLIADDDEDVVTNTGAVEETGEATGTGTETTDPADPTGTAEDTGVTEEITDNGDTAETDTTTEDDEENVTPAQQV